VAVLRLAQKGLLHLDQPATHYLPEGHPAHSLANASTATLRQLLNHTSGLYDYDTDTRYNLDALNQPGRVFTPADCFAYAKGKAATAAPGTEYRYCNTAYLLLGEVVGAVKEMPAQAAILAEVLQAANIPDTEWLASGSLPAHTLRGYDNRFGNARVTDVSHFRLGTGADGGLVSTVFDLRRYLTALYAQGSLLDSASLALMTQNRVTIPNTGGAQERSVESGLGVFRWQFRGNSCWANIGGQYGYRAFMAHFPENGSQLIVLANASLVGNDDPFFQLLDSLAEAIWP
jgi:D-alanyl-D-alanine carboxypeptidase